ncbi:MAG: fused MFS/spermidine synthase, partial [Burkholderiales bacterium]|nr:fused MFS/spermidine synthase [Burkholderiales bacterium]
MPSTASSSTTSSADGGAARSRRLLFELFFLSGFCGLVDQVVWIRLAFASFGIITPVVSVVISVFMLGLALGSWLAGRAIERRVRARAHSAILFYAGAEVLIGLGAFLVPVLFGFSEGLLSRAGAADSFSYLALSALAITVCLLPWCIGMGATFPLVMAYVRERGDRDERSFSYLYLANVLGASVGALAAAGVLVELLGFRHTLWLAGSINFVIAAAAVGLAIQARRGKRDADAPMAPPAVARTGVRPPWARTILFTTGFASLAMEVVWTRAFTPVLGTQVYAFATLLAVYLVATWMGSWWYRRDLARSRAAPVGVLLAGAAIASLLPVVLNDPRLAPQDLRAVLALASIVPFCAALGYLTPRLIDDISRGRPDEAGPAYALNVVGCVLGPLAASYLLLPFFGAAASLVLLSLPLIACAFLLRGDLGPAARAGAGVVTAGLAACALWVNVTYENPCAWSDSRCEVRRDHAATVVSTGEGMGKRMFVNGVGMTHLTSITKYMAHLPLAFHRGEPQSALVICFGMGTTYRSMLSWGVATTAVELVPGVRDAFGYYFDDASAWLADPRGTIVVDDGRRFLSRTRETYDVIVVDPPPPVEAAGSSLLYSREFHEAVRSRLKPGGVFQTWFPGGEARIAAALARSVLDVFPHVRAFRSLEGWGVHFLASNEPLDRLTARQILARMPPRAAADLA